MHAAAMCSSCSLLLKYYCASLILLNFSAAAQCSASCGLHHIYYVIFATMQVTRRRWQVKTMNLFVGRQGTIVQLLIHCASNFGPQ